MGVTNIKKSDLYKSGERKLVTADSLKPICKLHKYL